MYEIFIFNLLKNKNVVLNRVDFVDSFDIILVLCLNWRRRELIRRRKQSKNVRTMMYNSDGDVVCVRRLLLLLLRLVNLYRFNISSTVEHILVLVPYSYCSTITAFWTYCRTIGWSLLPVLKTRFAIISPSTFNL